MSSAPASRDFVLLHGAWHGAWCWARVAPILRAAGHRVFTPTQTGLGERRHLMSRDITLDTFVQDLVAVLEAEELTDAILVGHSFGGIAITGAADRVPQRIRHLIYLDSRIVTHGETAGSDDPVQFAARRRLAEESSGGVSVPPPPPAAFGVPDGPDADWVARRMTPHPFHTFDSKLHLAHAVGNGRPCTYISCTDPRYVPLDPSRAFARRQPGWQWREIATGHDAMVLAPDELARLLMEIAG